MHITPLSKTLCISIRIKVLIVTHKTLHDLDPVTFQTSLITTPITLCPRDKNNAHHTEGTLNVHQKCPYKGWLSHSVDEETEGQRSFQFVQLVSKAGIQTQFQCKYKCHIISKTILSSKGIQSFVITRDCWHTSKSYGTHRRLLSICNCLVICIYYIIYLLSWQILRIYYVTGSVPAIKNSKITKTDKVLTFLDRYCKPKKSIRKFTCNNCN